MIPKFNGIDHVHVYARDREAAATWYKDILGFSVVEEYRFWSEHEFGPLTIQDASETIHLALFKSDNFIPDSVLAFGVSGNGFLKWKAYLEEKDLLKRCSDHSKMWLYILMTWMGTVWRSQPPTTTLLLHNLKSKSE